MSNNEHGVDSLWSDVLAGRLDRRGLLKRSLTLGLTAPVIASLLAACGGDDDDDAPDTETVTTNTPATGAGTIATAGSDVAETPTAGDNASSPTAASTDDAGTGGTSGQGRGAGGLLRLLYWQAATNLNPHFSQGNLNSAPAALVLEPLLVVDADGNLIPVLAAEVPSIENGGLSADGKTITYKLLPDIVWSDGTPFTADDVQFTWEWATDPDANTTSLPAFLNVESVDVVDETTVTVTLKETDPAWYNAFSRGTGLGAQVLPKHLLQEYTGADAANAPFNLAPVGTGPYIVTDFRPGDVVLYEINENYREADKPFFTEVEFKGGGDAASAARAVLATEETDYALNLQVEKDILEDLLAEGVGDLVIVPSGNVEQIFINFTDPNQEVDGARSEPTTEHPFLTVKEVRQALALASDRDTIAAEFYGPAGEATPNVVVAPQNFVSPNTTYEFDTTKAVELLDAAGWTLDGDVRKKDGQSLKLIFQTTVNPLRQKTQEVIKAGWEEAGAEVELKSIDASVYFSTDAGNPDTWGHFYTDVEMATLTTSPYPIDLMTYWNSSDPAKDLAQKSNGWTGTNLNRWVNEEFNGYYQQARTELDPDTQADLFIAMNDLVVNEVVQIALVSRARVDGMSKKLKGAVPSPWTDETYDIANWYMEE